MKEVSSAIASILDVGKYVSSVVKALDDIAQFRVHSMERKQEREYLILSTKILKNLDHMLYERMFIVRELRDYLAHLDKYPPIEPADGEELEDRQIEEYRRRFSSISWHVGTSVSSIADLCAMTEYVLPQSVFGMEMKKLMMSTQTVNSYLLENLARFARPTPEFIAILRQVHDAHSTLSDDFCAIMHRIDEVAIRKAFLRFSDKLEEAPLSSPGNTIEVQKGT